MNKKTLTYVDYSSIKKNIDSGNMSCYNVVNLLKSELEKILLEKHPQFKIKTLDVFEKDVVRRYTNRFLTHVDFCNETDVAIIKTLQTLKEDIFHNKRITEDFILSSHIDAISKTKNKQYIISTLRSLEEQYRDTEDIQQKLFLRKQAEKCISQLFDYQKSFRKEKFDYKNIIEPLTLKP